MRPAVIGRRGTQNLAELGWLGLIERKQARGASAACYRGNRKHNEQPRWP